MQSENKILDDFARLASSAMGVAVGMRSEVEARLREQLERLLAQMDLVPREEFDAMKAVAIAAREEQEALSQKLAALEARLAALEARLAALEGGKAAAGKPAQKATAKKAATQKESEPKESD
ncbi:accessory factor UbiK family protein [Pelagibius sp.]|uniref:accessory factor UbiK family protein n=1 Tax=Pelagibius sp. TaxID=1931238 RepID=UPI00262250BC|nr:accessory factor UbiK family protein [Pelagibius sp.]